MEILISRRTKLVWKNNYGVTYSWTKGHGLTYVYIIDQLGGYTAIPFKFDSIIAVRKFANIK